MTVALRIPDDLADKVRLVTSDVKTYILELLRSNLEDLDRSTLLAHEYRVAALENAGLSKDFSYTDQKGWDDEY